MQQELIKFSSQISDKDDNSTASNRVTCSWLLIACSDSGGTPSPSNWGTLTLGSLTSLCAALEFNYKVAKVSNR